MKFFFEMKQFFNLAFEELRDWYARPSADNLGNIFFVDFFFQQSGLPLFLRQPFFFLQQSPFEVRKLPELQLGGPIEVVLAFGLFDFDLGLLDLLSERSQPLNRLLLGLPPRFERVGLCLQVGQFFFEFFESLFRSSVLLFLERFAFDLELHHTARYFIELRRHRINLRAKLRGRFVDEVNRLVRQEAV